VFAVLCLQVLSVQTALSIQSHPDKKLAEKLHAQQPKVRTASEHRRQLKTQATYSYSAHLIAAPV
jgi:mannose-6-phosphate isomerase